MTMVLFNKLILLLLLLGSLFSAVELTKVRNGPEITDNGDDGKSLQGDNRLKQLFKVEMDRVHEVRTKKKKRKKRPGHSHGHDHDHHHKPQEVRVHVFKKKKKRKRKIMKKYLLPILIGVIVVKSLILPIILKTVAIMSTKSMILSLVAFILSSLVATKLLLENAGSKNGNDKTTVEIIKVPYYRKSDYADEDEDGDYDRNRKVYRAHQSKYDENYYGY